MKLYATTTNEKGKKEGVGSENCVFTEFSYKNKIIGKIGVYTIFGGQGKHILGYRVVWKSDKTPVMGNILEEDVKYSLITKGKSQKGEKKCDDITCINCDNTMEGLCDNCRA